MLLHLQEKKSEAFERALDSFIEAAGKISANMLGMVNRVGGQIYALLFLSREPLSLDDIAEILKISKSNISINIRLLEDCKLVRKVWVKGSRKDFYEASRNYPKQFFRGFFDRLREGIDESIRISNKCREQFETVKRETKERSEDVEFILNQLNLLVSFYEAASHIFENFYQGKNVNIDLLRRVIFEE
jgi:DNA-binding transcriptional regulator GbsR (MarR family)